MPMIYLCFFLQSDQAIPGQTTVLVVVEGLVKYDGHKIHRFSQNFLLTAEGGTVWKVASDCFRFIQWRTWWKSTTFYWSCANIYLNHWFDWGMHTLYNGVLHVAPIQEMRMWNTYTQIKCLGSGLPQVVTALHAVDSNTNHQDVECVILCKRYKKTKLSMHKAESLLNRKNQLTTF